MNSRYIGTVLRFEESDLVFDIATSWGVHKYDRHKFFRGLSGHGLKGVDFIALLPDGRLGLIEVKNYHPRPKVDGSTHPVRRKKAADLAENLAKKFHDTQRALNVIQKYYRSKWYYRLRSFISWPLERLFNSDLYFYLEAAKRSQGELPVAIILWLETPKAAKTYRTKIYAHLANFIDPTEGQLLLGGNGFSPIPGISAHRIKD